MNIHHRCQMTKIKIKVEVKENKNIKKVVRINQKFQNHFKMMNMKLQISEKGQILEILWVRSKQTSPKLLLS